MRGVLAAFLAFNKSRRGVAAVEFALIAPLLCLILALSVEVVRMMKFERNFETATVGVARHLARYPEYELRAREYAKPVFRQLFPEGDVGSVNIKVDSLLKEEGKLKEVFPGHVLFGSDPGSKWQDNVKTSDYVDDESIIFVGATYKYRPLFNVIPDFTLTFTKDVVVLPSFGRHYPWNDRQVDDSLYVY